MSLATIGDSNVTKRVEETIRRRGATHTSVAVVWTSLAAAGGLLGVVAMFITWYAADRTATAWYSGFMPPIALLLVVAGAVVLVGKQFNAFGVERRVDSDLFTFAILGGGALLLMLRQITRGGLNDMVYLLIIPLVIWTFFVGQGMGGRSRSAKLELEQVALGLATIGAGLIVVKRVLDPEYATGGWAWGLLAALAVVVAALAGCQYLGILSLFQVMVFVALSLSVIILAILLAQVIGDGWPVLSERLADFWSGTLRSRSEDERLGISQGILGSFWIAAFVVMIAFPIGIASAVYLEEYAPRNKFTSMLDISVRNLAGVPSVVYGLLGLFLFVKGTVVTHWIIDRVNSVWASVFDEEQLIETGQSSLFAGGVTLAILVLPIVIITAAEAIRAVPQSLREGAFGVGATKWDVIRSQVLPFAAPGILTGTLLALARAVGEAAPLILVGAITGRLAPRDSMFSGLDQFFGQFADRFTAMPIVIVGWVRNSGVDKGFGPAAGAAIVMLLVFVILMNSIAVLLRNYFEKKRA
jgi:phosphate transport system permease protein